MLFWSFALLPEGRSGVNIPGGSWLGSMVRSRDAAPPRSGSIQTGPTALPGGRARARKLRDSGRKKARSFCQPAGACLDARDDCDACVRRVSSDHRCARDELLFLRRRLAWKRVARLKE